MGTLEVCIEDVTGLHACIEGGANQVELCSALDLGGLTPSAGLMRYAGQCEIPVFALIRPRAGDFCFTKSDVQTMCDDIATAGNAGLAGVVIGASGPHGRLNYKVMKQLSDAADSMRKTLHRVLDTMDDPLYAMEQAIDLEFDRVLTSGCKPTAKEGISVLQKLQQQANGRIQVVAGGGLTPENIPLIHRKTGITSFHSSCRRVVENDPQLIALGFASSKGNVTCAEKIKEYAIAANQLEN